MKTATDVFKVEYFAEEYKKHLQHLTKEGNEYCTDECGNIDMYVSQVISGANGWRTSYCLLELFDATSGMTEEDEWVYEEVYSVMSTLSDQLNSAVAAILANEGIKMHGNFYLKFSEADGDIAVFYYCDRHDLEG